jgi:hypothetical protein
MMRRARSLRLAMAVALAMAMPTTVDAAVGLWTLVGSPLTAPSGVSTTFTLTVTNEDVLSQIGCVEVSTTSHFRVDDTAITNGLPWTIGDSESHTQVTARSTNSGGALGLLESLVFTVTATPLDPGAWSWSGMAYQDISCGGSPLAGVALVAIVVTAATPTPTPAVTPTPTPTPMPTVPPSAAPTATPSPTRTPSPTPTSSPARRETPSSTAIPGTTPTSVAAGEPNRSGAPATPEPTGSGTATSRSSRAAPTPDLGRGSAILDDPFTVSSRNVSIDADLSSTRFALQPILVLVVPAILLSGPGLLLILAFVAQVTGALAWLPIVRRHLGERKPSPRVRFSRRSSRP